PERFGISEAAVKRQARVLKSVIKLDKNFHIYVHGRREYITRGYDEKTGLHFYQLFFREEE
ncbi:MAG: nucleoid-associated protein, partial [Prevotellaceae bacterium]|nr:nucleoid-associated protein [Prevotellaceae bacterium]